MTPRTRIVSAVLTLTSIARDSRGNLWFGIEDSGLDKLDPATGTFTHYRNDSDGHFVGRINNVIADSRGNIWFVGERGLFHLNPATGQITRPPAIRNGLGARESYADEAGNLWMVANSTMIGLLKYDRQAERLTNYPFTPVLSASLHPRLMGARLIATLSLMGRMGYGCHRVRVSITLTGEHNVSRTGFSTMNATRIASTLTPLCRSIG